MKKLTWFTLVVFYLSTIPAWGDFPSYKAKNILGEGGRLENFVVDNVAIDNSSVDNTSVGQGTPRAGSFTDLSSVSPPVFQGIPWPKYPYAGDGTNDNASVIRVTDHGAVSDPGDESTDSATAIDNAVATAGDAGGGTVLVPDGTWILGTVSVRSGSSNSYIVPRDNVTIVLAPNATLKVKAISDPNALRNIIYTTALLQNFSIIAQGPGSTIDGGNNLNTGSISEIKLNTFVGSSGGGYGNLIKGVTFKNMSGHNPIVFAGSSGTRGENIIEKCRFIDGGSALAGNVNDDFSAIYLLGTNNRVIENIFRIAAFGDNTTTAWENHGIDFEAYGNRVLNYRMPFYITSESGNCKSMKIHDNIFDNVYAGMGFGSGNNNGFGQIDYYNNIVTLRPGAAADGILYLLYGPDTTTDTADEWNLYSNRFYGSGEAVRLVSGIGAKIFRFNDNYAENFAGYGYLQSTGATFDSTYANYVVEISRNTFRNFTAGQPIVSFGGTVKHLFIEANKLVSDAAVAITAIYLRTTANGGTFKGNYIDNTYTTDIDFGSGMANVFVDHHLRNLFDRTANYGALGSRVYDGERNQTFVKVSTDGTWMATGFRSSTPSITGQTDGDIMWNTGTDNTIGWKYNSGWKYMQVTLEP